MTPHAPVCQAGCRGDRSAGFIGIHASMDMTLPGLLSQQSVAEGGRWVDVPDSREWAAAATQGAKL